LDHRRGGGRNIRKINAKLLTEESGDEENEELMCSRRTQHEVSAFETLQYAVLLDLATGVFHHAKVIQRKQFSS
jgi:hypothetical protein